jgi:O-antigen ligase
VLPTTVVLLLPAVFLGNGSALPHVAAMLAIILATGVVCLRACDVDPRAPVILASALVGTLLVQAGMAIYELRTGHRISVYGGAGVAGYGPGYFFDYGGTFRPGGTFSDPISLGNVLAATVPIAFALASSRRISTPLRVLNGVGAVVISIGLAVTLSRMAWIGAAVGILVVVVVSAPGERLLRVSWAAGAGVAVQAVILAIGSRPLIDRFHSILDPTASTVSTASGDVLRQRLWSVSFRAFEEHPLFGVGFDRLAPQLAGKVPGAGIFTHAHSTYLQFLAEAGLLGATALAAVLVAAAADARRGLRGPGRLSPVACGAAGGLAATAISWLTDYVVRYPGVLACLAVLFTLVAAEGRSRNAAPAAQTPPRWSGQGAGSRRP